MAKKSAIEHNNFRKDMVDRKSVTRARLKSIMMNKNTSFEERIAVMHKLAEMPRNSARVRVRNRCVLTGRPRGYYRKFGLSRIALRELGSAGFLPGLIKASW